MIESPTVRAACQPNKLRHLNITQELKTERKLKLYALLGIGEGGQVLDVGCGAGSDTIPLDRALRAGAVTQAEIARFRSGLERAAVTGTFFATINMVIVTGRKP